MGHDLAQAADLLFQQDQCYVPPVSSLMGTRGEGLQVVRGLGTSLSALILPGSVSGKSWETGSSCHAEKQKAGRPSSDSLAHKGLVRILMAEEASPYSEYK